MDFIKSVIPPATLPSTAYFFIFSGNNILAHQISDKDLIIPSLLHTLAWQWEPPTSPPPLPFLLFPISQYMYYIIYTRQMVAPRIQYVIIFNLI